MRIKYLLILQSYVILISATTVTGQQTPCLDQFDRGEAFYVQAKYDSSILHFRQALACLPDKGPATVKANMRTGGAFIYLSKLDSAEKYIDIAIGQAQVIRDTGIWNTLLLEEAVIRQQKGEYEAAAETLLQAIELNRQIGADSMNADFYINLSMLYEELGDSELDRKYSQKALKMSRRFGRKRSEVAASMSLAALFGKENKLDSARILLNHVDTLSEELNDPIFSAYVHLNKAAILGGPDAQTNFLKSINTEEVPLYDRLNFRSYYAKYLLENQAYDKALQQVRIILAGADSIGAVPVKVEALPNLIAAYVGMRRFKDAFYAQQSLQHLNDSIHSEELKRKVSELNVKYETTLKEKENEQLAAANARKDLQIQQYRNRVRWQTLVVISSLAGLFVAIFLWYQNKRLSEKDYEILERRNELKEMALQRLSQERELEILSARMKGEEQERDRVARELHDGLGILLSSIKLSILSKEVFDPQTSAGLVDRASSELRQIAQNLSPQSLNKFGLYTAIEDLCSDMSSDRTMVYFQPLRVAESELEPLKTQLYRMVQELVTNCIKHAEASEILVQVSKSGDSLRLIVEDDGAGMDPSAPVGKGHFGLTNIRHRLSQLRGHMQIESKIDQGTTVDIEIPLLG